MLKETRELVKFAVTGVAAYEAANADGKIDFSDLVHPSTIALFGIATQAFVGTKLIPNELGEANDNEITLLVDETIIELGIVSKDKIPGVAAIAKALLLAAAGIVRLTGGDDDPVEKVIIERVVNGKVVRTTETRKAA